MRRLLLVIAALAVPGVGWCEDAHRTKEVPEKNIYSICHGYPSELQGIIGFDDPYDIKGKCFFARISSRFGQKQWLSNNSVLIIDAMPGSMQEYTTVINDETGHIKYNSSAILIGTEPTNYTSTSGQMIISPTLSVLRYIGPDGLLFPGSGALGEPVHSIHTSIEYPPDALENNWSGKVTTSCLMERGKSLLWHATGCSIVSFDGDKEAKEIFSRSCIDYNMRSAWLDKDLPAPIGADKKMQYTCRFILQDDEEK
ncbi:hypothetical protein [Acetobacter sp. LMG 32666]|uniref:hypothetical protein n=1 Tax=Acetobacter sp. LMG 32666 TaxID=2959295 RepID=UPI0030C7C503